MEFDNTSLGKEVGGQHHPRPECEYTLLAIEWAWDPRQAVERLVVTREALKCTINACLLEWKEEEPLRFFPGNSARKSGKDIRFDFRHV